MNRKRIETSDVALALAAIAVLVAVSGCGKLDSRAGSLVSPAVAQADGGATVAGVGGGNISLPTLDELRSKLVLTDAQVKPVGVALDAWRSAVRQAPAGAPPVGGPPQGGPGMGGPGMGGPSGRGGPRGGGGPQGGGLGSGAPNRDDCDPAPPPHLEFLSDTAPVLDAKQFANEAAIVAQHVGQQPPPASPGGPRGPLGAMLGKLAHDFGLSQDVVKEIADAFRTAHEAVAQAVSAFAQGGGGGATVHDAAQSAHDQLVQALHGALASDAYDALRQALATARTQGAQCRLDHLSSSVQQHSDQLAKLLALDDAQKQRLIDALSARLPQEQALLTAVRDGTLSYADAVAQGASLRHDVDQAIRSLLTADQQTRFDALQSTAPPMAPPMWI